MVASWTVEVWRPLGGVVTQLPFAHDKVLTPSLDDGDTFSFSINGLDENAKLLHPLTTDIVVYRNELKIFRGRLTAASPSTDSISQTVACTAVDYRSLLKRRYILTSATATADIESVAWSYINTVQTRTAAHNMGITRGQGQAAGITVTGYIAESGSTVKDLIDGLCETNTAVNSINAFEWTIDPDLAFRLYQPTRGKRTPTFVADWGGSVLSFDQQFDPSSYSNYFYVQGNGPYQASVSTDEARRPAAGAIFEEYVNDSAMTTATQVDSRAFWLATYNGQMELCKTYNLEISNNRWDGPKSCWIGDFIKLDLRVGVVNVVTDQMRIRSMHIQVDDSGMENIAIEVGYSVPSSYRDFNRMTNFLKTTKNDILARRANWYNTMQKQFWDEYMREVRENGEDSYEANASLERFNDFLVQKQAYFSQGNQTSRY